MCGLLFDQQQKAVNTQTDYPRPTMNPNPDSTSFDPTAAAASLRGRDYPSSGLARVKRD
jgi:hypothetical protein